MIKVYIFIEDCQVQNVGITGVEEAQVIVVDYDGSPGNQLSEDFGAFFDDEKNMDKMMLDLKKEFGIGGE